MNELRQNLNIFGAYMWIYLGQFCKNNHTPHLKGGLDFQHLATALELRNNQSHNNILQKQATWGCFRLFFTTFLNFSFITQQNGRQGLTQRSPMGQKIYTTKNYFICHIISPYGPGNFPKKAKIRKSGGAGFRRPLQGRNMVSRDLYDLLRHHKKVKRKTLYLTNTNESDRHRIFKDSQPHSPQNALKSKLYFHILFLHIFTCSIVF